MDLAEHFRLIWRRRWVIVLLSVAIAGAVFARSRALPKVYEAVGVVDVISESASAEALTREQVEIAVERFGTLATTTNVLREAIRQSGLDITVDEAKARISTGTSTSGFLDLRAEGPTPDEAEDLAASVMTALIAAAEAQDDVVLEVSPASASDTPVAPTPEKDALLALLIALVVNAELAAVLGTVAGRLPSGHVREEVERMTNARVLARIPKRGREEVVESFRELRAQVDFARGDLDIRSVAVTGTEPGVGSSYIARGLAQVAANLKQSVILVDANLRRPAVATELRLPPSPGLGDLLLGSGFDAGILRQANPLQKRFRVLTAGLAVPDAPGLLGAGALRKVLDQISDAELIVIDTPAVSEAADALVIAAQADATILVVDGGKTRRRTLNDVVARLQPHARLLGSVVNRTEPGSRGGGRGVL